jgi:hypothetical protein
MGTSLNPQRQKTLTAKDGPNVSSAGEQHQIDPDFIRSVIKSGEWISPECRLKQGRPWSDAVDAGNCSELASPILRSEFKRGRRNQVTVRDLLEKYNFDVNKALAAYNAGPQRVDRYQRSPSLQ